MKKSLASNDETIWHLCSWLWPEIRYFARIFNGISWSFVVSALKNNILAYKTYVLITQRSGVRIPPAVDDHLQ